jgi:hypothetical protein
MVFLPWIIVGLHRDDFNPLKRGGQLFGGCDGIVGPAYRKSRDSTRISTGGIGSTRSARTWITPS